MILTAYPQSHPTVGGFGIHYEFGEAGGVGVADVKTALE